MSTLQKQIILGFAVILLGAFFWYFLHYVFYVGNLTTGCWIAGGTLFLLWGIGLCLAMLLIDDNKVLYGSFLITLGLLGLFFLAPSSRDCQKRNNNSQRNIQFSN